MHDLTKRHSDHAGAYIETLTTYGNDAASSHLTMPFWLIDEGNMIGGDCSKPERMSNGGFCARWNRLKESQTVEMCGRLHSDICNVPLFLLNGVKIQIKLTKAKRPFYLLSDRADTKATFKFQEGLLYVKRIRPAPSILYWLYWQATRPDTTSPGSNSRLSHFLAGRNLSPSTMPCWGSCPSVCYSPW